MDSDVGIQLFVSDLLNADINSDGDSKRSLLNNFVDILDDFDDLRHNDNLFDNLFEDVWHFNDFFHGGADGDNSLFKLVNVLDLVLDDIRFVLFDGKLLNFNDLVSVRNDLFHCSL